MRREHAVRVEFIVHIITHRRASRRTFYSRKIVLRFNFEVSHRVANNSRYCLFNFFSCSCKIRTRPSNHVINNVVIKWISHDIIDKKICSALFQSTSSINNAATLRNNCHSYERLSYLWLSIGYSRESIQVSAALEILASGSPHGSQFARVFSLRVSSRHFIHGRYAPQNTVPVSFRSTFRESAHVDSHPAKNRRRGARCIVTSSRRCRQE